MTLHTWKYQGLQRYANFSSDRISGVSPQMGEV